jgi:hypothetical protein
MKWERFLMLVRGPAKGHYRRAGPGSAGLI